MKIQVPKWVTKLDDDHLVILAWFCDRMNRQHGWGQTYSMHIEDIIRITNKRNLGLMEWLTSRPVLSDKIRFGHLYDEVIIFTMQEPKYTRQEGQRGRTRVEQFYTYELTEQRAKYIYMYLLGCLNSNLLADGDGSDISEWHQNAYGIKEFHITRVTQGYIKKLGI